MSLSIQNASKILEKKKYLISYNKKTALPFDMIKPSIMKSSSYNKKGHWTQREKLKFCIFMDYHRGIFKGKPARRLFKIFKCMAQFIKTRNANQCRSHHQKMEKQYGDLLSFIVIIIKANGRRTYEYFFNLLAAQLKMMHTNIQMETIEQKVQEIYVPKAEFQDEDPLPDSEKEARKEAFIPQKDVPTGQGLEVGDYKDQEKEEKPHVVFFSPVDWANQQCCASPSIPKDPKLDLFQFQGCSQYPEHQIYAPEKPVQSQRDQLLWECNYYWGQWLKSTLKLESVVQKAEFESRQ